MNVWQRLKHGGDAQFAEAGYSRQKEKQRIQKYALASGADIFQPEKDEDGNYKDDADGTEWYNHWYSSRFQYSQIVRELFLRSTTHAGGTSVEAKCRELGVDPSAGVTIEFDPDMNEDNYYEC